MAPNDGQQRKGFTLIPPGQHPGVTANVPEPAEENADGVVISTDSRDSLVRNAINQQPKPAPAEQLPQPEPILSDADEDDEPQEPDIDPILDLAGANELPQRISQFSEMARQATDDLRRAADANRNTVLAQFIERVAVDPSHAVDSEMRLVFDEFLIANLMSTATAETSIKDLGFAISEHGAKLVVDEKSAREQLQKLLWIRSYRSLLNTLNLDEYSPVLMALEIERTFGRTQTAEDLKQIQEKNDERTAIASLVESIDALRNEVKRLNRTETTQSSVFLKQRPTGDPAARPLPSDQRPVPPAAPADQPN